MDLTGSPLAALFRLGFVPSLESLKRQAVAAGNMAAVDAILRREVLREFDDASQCYDWPCELREIPVEDEDFTDVDDC